MPDPTDLFDAEHDAQALLAEVERLRPKVSNLQAAIRARGIPFLCSWCGRPSPSHADGLEHSAVCDASPVVRRALSAEAEVERLREALRNVLPYALAFRPPPAHASTYAGFVVAARAALEPTP